MKTTPTLTRAMVVLCATLRALSRAAYAAIIERTTNASDLRRVLADVARECGEVARNGRSVYVNQDRAEFMEESLRASRAATAAQWLEAAVDADDYGNPAVADRLAVVALGLLGDAGLIVDHRTT